MGRDSYEEPYTEQLSYIPMIYLIFQLNFFD